MTQRKKSTKQLEKVAEEIMYEGRRYIEENQIERFPAGETATDLGLNPSIIIHKDGRKRISAIDALHNLAIDMQHKMETSRNAMDPRVYFAAAKLMIDTLKELDRFREETSEIQRREQIEYNYQMLLDFLADLDINFPKMKIQQRLEDFEANYHQQIVEENSAEEESSSYTD